MEGRPPASEAAARRRRAQSLVELGLILPTFVLLALGVVDLGRAFYDSIAIHGAAEAGSLIAMDYKQNDVGTPGSGNVAIRTAIKAATNPDVFPFLQIQDSDIDLSGVPWSPNSPYTITVTLNFQLLTPFLGNVFGGSQVLTLRSVVRGRHNCDTLSC